MPRHDVAIYAPAASPYYDRATSVTSGGAERQTVLLARELARRGLRVAHIVRPVADPVVDAAAPVTLIQQPALEAHGSARYFAAKSREIWRGLSEADATVQVFRGADGTVGVGGIWAHLRGRRLLFAGANNSDFTLETFPSLRDPRTRLYRYGIRHVDGLIVQTDDQLALARDRFPRAPQPLQVNSFVEPAPAADAAGEAFLWVSRIVDYKRPELYVRLAAALPEARFWMVASATGEANYDASLAEVRRLAAELPNLELLDPRPHAELQQLIGRAVAMVNTSSFEGMPNTWLEGWARGVPALTFSFDPDGRIARHRLGVDAGGDWDAFVAAARRMWDARETRDGYGERVRAYVGDAHGTQVGDAWEAMVRRLLARA